MTFEILKDRVVIGSPPEYEQLVAEIYINDQPIAIISRESCDETMQIEFLIEHAPKDVVSLGLFMSLINKAKMTLLSHDRV